MHRSSCVFLSIFAFSGCAKPARDAHGLDYPSTVSPALPVTPPRAPRATSPSAEAAPAIPNSTPPSHALGGAAFVNDAPVLLERASRTGRFLALCTKHEDNQFERYLVAEDAELPIDGLLDADASGRYAILLQRGALVLWDAHSRKFLDLSALGADARLSAQSFAESRTLAFDASSTHLLYVRLAVTGKRVVIRSLEDGSERELDPGPGVIWRARFDPGGVFVIVELLSDDSNNNGRVDFPAPLASAPRPCNAGPARFHTWVDRGDRPVRVLLPLSGGSPVLEPDLVMPIGEALLLRDANGALLLSRAGKRRVLEPAACKGRIVHADAQRELFIIGCAQKKTGRVSLELVTRSEHKALGIELASVELDRELSDAPRLFALYPGPETMLFDADRRQLVPLRSADVVLATNAGRALIRRGNTLLFYDVDSRSEQALPVTLHRYPELLSTPPFVFISPALVNLERAALVGVSSSRPLALSSAGELLVPEVEADGSQLARGPLRWLTPSL